MATVSMVLPLSAAASAVHRQPSAPTSGAFFKPLQVKKSKLGFTTDSKAKLRVEASLKEKVVAGITAAVAASMVVPEVAQAADSMTPSLKNFLLSIGAGGIVLGVIAGAIVGVSNFDPVKRS